MTLTIPQIATLLGASLTSTRRLLRGVAHEQVTTGGRPAHVYRVEDLACMAQGRLEEASAEAARWERVLSRLAAGEEEP